MDSVLSEIAPLGLFCFINTYLLAYAIIINKRGVVMPMDRFQREALRLEKEKIQIEKKKLEQDKREQRRRRLEHAETQHLVAEPENARLLLEQEAQLRLESHHIEHISLLRKIKNAEWIRWLITTSIAVIALIIAILALMQDTQLDLLQHLLP